MCLKKLIAAALVMSVAAVSVIAQPVTQLNKDESKISASEAGKNRSQTLTYEAMRVEGSNHDLSLTAIIDVTDSDANPIVLSRSFKDAMRENLDKDTMERLIK